MPSRPRTSKVTKHNVSARNRKSLYNTTPQNLEYSVVKGNVNGYGSNGSPVPLGLSQMALPLSHSSPLSNTGGGDGGDDFSFTNNPSPYPTLSPRRYTAAELAYSKYGAAVKLDSALSRKVANEAAKRSPTQRRSDQKLNIDRRSNMEAFLAHVTGQAASKPCKNCHKGHGPWKECVVYDGQMCGSCTNCWYNASGSRCTFHGSGAATASVTSPTAAPSAGVPPETHDEATGDNLPYYSSPKDDLKTMPDWATAHHDNESNVSSQSQSHVPEPLPVQPPAFMDYHQPPPLPHGLHNVEMALGGGGGGAAVAAAAAAAPWMAGDSTRRLINQAMGDVAMLSRRDRYIARIETAAEELAMRITEFNEYMETPEGMADLQHFQETAGSHMMPPGHTHDARLETMETDSVHGGSPMP
ncbi:hypothetical protein BBO_02873 [Beauveria brongniartii RCEF 3172]|uniref:Uncharacterized protein n=1 Tax=Beauveria brongniartii RCEF 3172 TaxID=1081107 RepID=A0A162JQ28_9HYPO|nr:hypothetical protein BBO_02873 [Beauveria brongniartii RCEF 3172]